MIDEELALNEIRKRIKMVNFRDILLEEFRVYNKNIYDKFETFEDVILLPVFTTECFKIIYKTVEEYTGENIDIEKRGKILNYIEDQKYYEDGNYLNIISELKIN